MPSSQSPCLCIDQLWASFAEHVFTRTSHFVDDEAAERCVCHEQERRYPFCIARVVYYVVGLGEERHGAGNLWC